MAEYANYSEQGMEQGPLHPRSIASTQWELQKGSMLWNMTKGSMWKAAEAGKGLTWSGVVGFRGIAAGTQAFEGRMATRLSPANAVHGIIDAFSAEKASTFKASGLFGQGGLLNKGNNEFLNTLGKFVGGGNIAASKFIDPRLIEKELRSKIMDRSGIFSAKKTMIYGRSAPLRAHIKAMKGHIAANPYTVDEIKSKAYNMWQKAGKEGAYHDYYRAAQKELTSNVKDIARKNIATQTTVRRLARVGRLAGWVGAATIAYDVGSFIGGFAVNTLGSVADKLERTMTGLVNRQMEFGGKVGVGFFSGASGTERQRALSAIGQGRGSSGMGSEAGYQHVDSTW